jgi:tRNA(adenine34) deaminase
LKKDKNMEKTDQEFMRIAIEEAAHALQDGVLPVAAVAVMNGKIVGMGRRHKGDHPYLDHAEIGAVKEALGNSASGDSITLYSVLEPCLMCFATILNSRRVKRIVYSLEDPYGGGTSLRQSILTPRYKEWWPQTERGVLREEALTLFEEFFKTTQDVYWLDTNNPLRKLVEDDKAAFSK